MQDLREKLRVNLSAILSSRRNSWQLNALGHSISDTTRLEYLASGRHLEVSYLGFEYFIPSTLPG